MEEADLLAFQEAHQLDERCMRGLSLLPPSDRIVIMDSVSNTRCQNPSAVTWSGVRRIQNEPGAFKLEYVLRHLDEKCMESFRRLPTHAQEQIAHRLDAATCRNVSAFVFSQVRSVQSMPAPTVHPAALRSPRVMAPGAPRLRSRSPYLESRDLSACSTEDLLAEAQRINAELAARNVHHPPPNGGFAEVEGLMPDAAAFAARHGLDIKVQQALAFLDAEAQCIAIGLVDLQAARNPSAVMWGMVKRLQESRAQVKQEFVEKCLDQQAKAAWVNVAPESKSEILETVDVSKVRNVSAVIWSRIQNSDAVKIESGLDAQAEDIIRAYRPLPFENTNQSQEPAPFSRMDLDERCSAELRMLPPELQDQILKEIPPNPRNPSAAVWSKVKQYKNAAAPVAAVPPAATFAGPTIGAPAAFELDDRCSQKFKTLPPELQNQVLSEVPPDCRNLSAYVWSKIKSIRV